MSQTFIPLDQCPNYLDPKLWNVCTAAVITDLQIPENTLNSNGKITDAHINSSVETIKQWSKNTTELVMFLEYHGLSGVTHRLLRNHSISFPTTANLTIKASTAKHAQRWEAICQALQLIQNAATKTSTTTEPIDFCLLKGSALATQIYPSPYERAMSDIDIMCSSEHTELFYRECLAQGFYGPELTGHDLKKHHHLPALSINIGQHRIDLEIHTHALSFDLNTQLHWSDVKPCLYNIDIAGNTYKTLSLQDTLLHLCVHAFARDQVIKLSNFVDIFRLAFMFEQEIDWATFSSQHPDVILMLRYSRLILDLPANSLIHIKPILDKDTVKITGRGAGMMPLREFNNTSMSLSQRLNTICLLNPNGSSKQTIKWLGNHILKL